MQADWEDEHGNKHQSDDDKDFKPHDPFQLNAQKAGHITRKQNILLGQ